MAGFVEDLADRHGVENPLQLSVAVTDGDRIIAARYSSEGSRDPFLQHRRADAQADVPRCRRVAADLRRSARYRSEPLGDLAGVWNEAPESSYTGARTSSGLLFRAPPDPDLRMHRHSEQGQHRLRPESSRGVRTMSKPFKGVVNIDIKDLDS